MNHYWEIVWNQFKKSKIGMAALLLVLFFFLVGLYAPLFASSKPLLVYWNGALFSPLLRYLFYSGFFTKPIDIFFNLFMFTLPIMVTGLCLLNGLGRKIYFWALILIHFSVFMWILSGTVKDPASYMDLSKRPLTMKREPFHFHQDPLLAPLPEPRSWSSELSSLSEYGKLNLILQHKLMKMQHERLLPYWKLFSEKTGRQMPTLWHVWQRNENSKLENLKAALTQQENKYQETKKKFPILMEGYLPFSHSFIMAKYSLKHAFAEEKAEAENQLEAVMIEAEAHRTPLANARQILMSYRKNAADVKYLEEKKEWLEKESRQLKLIISPLIRNFHWEEDAGGSQEANHYLPWWELTRVNRKDLLSSLLFGIRVSIVVGFSTILIALAIGIPLGIVSGYFAGRTDLVICRLIEMWEAMPTFFMLLMIVAIVQSKSIFIVILVLGIFGWTGISRFIRAEVLRQRNLSYVTACQALGFTHGRIMFSHILPNAIPPVLTLLPFSIMAAITSEAGLSFLGLGEEGSTSWGVLMDEGRSAFPGESYLLWPPAILLTLLLVGIALIGDRLRDAIDPKMR
jgi:peptide/nickel transport system permease protein